uniref:Uncharacterized protein n=1 Tax=Arundo donax TaxID=35708 RepID=A0A0A9HAE1_ARUDO
MLLLPPILSKSSLFSLFVYVYANLLKLMKMCRR